MVYSQNGRVGIVVFLTSSFAPAYCHKVFVDSEPIESIKEKKDGHLHVFLKANDADKRKDEAELKTQEQNNEASMRLLHGVDPKLFIRDGYFSQKRKEPMSGNGQPTYGYGHHKTPYYSTNQTSKKRTPYADTGYALTEAPTCAPVPPPKKKEPAVCLNCLGSKACDGPVGDEIIGCGSCIGKTACRNSSSLAVGDSTCNSEDACRFSAGLQAGDSSCSGQCACARSRNMNVGNHSCNGYAACYRAENAIVGSWSCLGDFACYNMGNASQRIEDKSCIGPKSCFIEDLCMPESLSIGPGSCQGYRACYFACDFGNTTARNVTVQANACNCDGCCNDLPDGCVVMSGMCNGPDTCNGGLGVCS